MYIFSAVGVYLYGGMLSRDPLNPSSILLNQTSYAESEYWANNFNDMLSGMNVIFNLLVVNNWPIMENALLEVTKMYYHRIFFVLVYIFGFVVVNNIVIALIIESFMREWQKNVQNKGDGAEISSKGGVQLHVEFDARNITGTDTNLHGRYLAKFRRTAKASINCKKTLRELFSPA